MFEVQQTARFRQWLEQLGDKKGVQHILSRIDRLGDGHWGDAKNVGDGVSELRIHSGPGYRLYFTRMGSTVLLLLCGGNKTSQARDIGVARQMVKTVKG